MNAAEYPDSWNVYNSLDDAYLKNGNKELAKANYKKSLKMNPNNESAKKALEKMEEK